MATDAIELHMEEVRERRGGQRDGRATQLAGSGFAQSQGFMQRWAGGGACRRHGTRFVTRHSRSGAVGREEERKEVRDHSKDRV